MSARFVPTTVLVAGGGPAALEAVLALREAGGQVDLHLLSPDPSYHYRPLSVVEPFASGVRRSYPLNRLERLGVRVHRDALASVAAERRVAVTTGGAELPYDELVVAAGAVHRRAVAHALTFSGPAAVEALQGLVQDMEAGYTEHVAFVVPAGASWSTPLYELVLHFAHRARGLGLDRLRITVVTHEHRPLEIFGGAACELVEGLLRDQGIEVITGAVATSPATGRLDLGPARGELRVDRIVALPVPGGRAIPGLPSDEEGFVPVDEHGRVRGVEHVYAAGDGTNSAVKQGGLAAQQADAAVAALLADCGLNGAAAPGPRQLRAALLAGDRAWYLRRDLESGAPAEVSARALWWPPSKIAGRLLAPFLDELDAEQSVIRLERRMELRPGVRRLGVVGRPA